MVTVPENFADSKERRAKRKPLFDLRPTLQATALAADVQS
jgi:hypothetical protein